MNWPALLQELLSRHVSDAQAGARIERALQRVREGVEDLGRLGHQFHLAEGSAPARLEWPRMMFHLNSAPNGRVVRSEFEREELGPGWFFTLAESQHWDGAETQFAGRGGVPRTGLPAPTELEPSEIFDAEQNKARRIAEFKAQLKPQPKPRNNGAASA